MKKRLTAVIFTLAVLGVSCSSNKDNPDAYGSFEATEVTVSSLANGKIMMFRIEEGQLLDSNQLVGFIDTTDLHLVQRRHHQPHLRVSGSTHREWPR